MNPMKLVALRYPSLRSILVATALCCTPLAAFAPAAAHACGPYVMSKEASVRFTVWNHFNAVSRGDAARLTALWDPDAQITSGSRTENAKSAIARWTQHGKDVRHVIQSLAVVGDRATVHARVTFAGATYDDLLTLARKNGSWRLIAKVSQPMVASVGAMEPRNAY
jgi:ketosteroid isomerase-like protein